MSESMVPCKFYQSNPKKRSRLGWLGCMVISRTCAFPMGRVCLLLEGVEEGCWANKNMNQHR